VSRHSLVHDAKRFEPWWRIWFLILLIVNVAGPLLFIGRLEAQLTLAAYVIAALIIVPMHRRLGWVRLLGVGHLVWLPLIPWLISRYFETAPSGAYGVWLLSVIVVDAACLAIDVIDVARYATGDRQPIVPR
jgi:hypothetical protein